MSELPHGVVLPDAPDAEDLMHENMQLRAELEDRKEHDALAAFFGGPGEESINSAKRARETLAELTALRARVTELTEALEWCIEQDPDLYGNEDPEKGTPLTIVARALSGPKEEGE